MPRTYSFEHFTVPTKETNLIPEQEKREYVEARHGPSEGKIHYGQKYARTKEMAAAKREGVRRAKAAGKARAERPAQAQARAAGEEVLPIDVRERLGTPIGAIPAQEEPLLEQQPILSVLAGRATTRIRLARLAARDLALASWKLAMLPWEAARMTARRLVAREA